MQGMLDHSGLSTANYDSTLIGWSPQELEAEVELGAEGVETGTGPFADLPEEFSLRQSKPEQSGYLSDRRYFIHY